MVHAISHHAIMLQAARGGGTRYGGRRGLAPFVASRIRRGGGSSVAASRHGSLPAGQLQSSCHCVAAAGGGTLHLPRSDAADGDENQRRPRSWLSCRAYSGET